MSKSEPKSKLVSPPAARRPPPEWAPHVAVWVAWPHLDNEWAEHFAPAKAEWIAMCEAIVDADPATRRPRGEELRVLVLDANGEREAREAVGHLTDRFHHAAFGDIWMRDMAPIFRAQGPACFEFNGWGGKYIFDGDTEVARTIASFEGLAPDRYPFVLEGGALDWDDAGTFLTTRECVLNPNRNAGWTEATVEHALVDSLGAESVVWLERGLRNDHTDGHVDTLARFVAPGVVVAMEPVPDDPNAPALNEVLRALRGARDARGKPLEVVVMPSPGEVLGSDGELMPASYANFYIGNTTVVVPTYDRPNDEAAVAVVARLFPSRRTVGRSARAILSGGGAFHCITQQVPHLPAPLHREVHHRQPPHRPTEE